MGFSVGIVRSSTAPDPNLVPTSFANGTVVRSKHTSFVTTLTSQQVSAWAYFNPARN